jgi:hypothetical protein
MIWVRLLVLNLFTLTTMLEPLAGKTRRFPGLSETWSRCNQFPRTTTMGTAFPTPKPPPPPSVVASLVGDWLKETNEEPPGGCHIIEHLAERHAAFERIHPFPDGNGRAGRLVLTMLLVQNGYPPAIIYKGERKRYLTALQRADEGDPGALAELLARSVLEGIYRFLMPNLAGPLSVVPLAGLADADLSRAALVGAAQRSRLKANKYGGNWYSTRQWVDEYKASRHPGRALSDPA